MVETRGGRRFAVFFLVAAFLVLLLGRWLRPVNDLAMTTAAPFAAVISGAANAVGDTVGSVIRGPQIAAENDRLRRELALVIEQNAKLQQAELDNKKLTAMLHFTDLYPKLQMLPARVIANEPTGLSPDIIISKGSRDGVRPGMTVVDQNGYFVGSISYVDTNAAKVLLLVNPSSTVGAVDLHTRATGNVVGQFGGPPQLSYVTTNSSLRIGDFVLTSGQADLYPRGLVIGQITRIFHNNVSEFQSADLQPGADFSHLELVQVVKSFVPNMPLKLLNEP